MKIRYRLLLAITLTVGLSSVAVHYASTEPIKNSFRLLETERAEEDVLRVSQAFVKMQDDLHTKSADWANSDDSYEFMSSGNKEFRNSKLQRNAIEQLRVSGILLFNSKMQLKASTVLPSVAYNNSSIPSHVQSELQKKDVVAHLENKREGIVGLIEVGKRPMMLSVRGIHKSTGDGVRRGWIVFLRAVDDTVILELGEVSRQKARILPFVNSVQSSDSEQEGDLLKNRRTVHLAEISPSEIEGSSVVRDIHDEPILTIKTRLLRRISAEGMRAINNINSNLLYIALFFCAVIVFVIEHFAVLRISNLITQLKRINGSSPSLRVELAGKDEVSALSDRINEMLSEIEGNTLELKRREEQLVLQNENLEQIVVERTQQIEYQAFHDKLTGLPNRALFSDRLRFAFDKMKRNHKGIATLFIDLDNFKVINDSLGHDMGDELLIAVTKVLTGSIRPGDTVARLGGDEFTILLEELHDFSEAEVIANRILTKFREPILLGNRETYAGGSIGIAFTEDPELSTETILKNADIAMYRAKAAGKSNYMVFDESMNEHALERLELETALRKAMDSGEIHVEYQPIIGLENNQVVGAEALARWTHPNRGQISPDLFIPIAEDTGLIFSIGYWVLEQACVNAKQWIQLPGLEEFVVCVNLSGKQIQRSDVVEQVHAVLEKTGLPPHHLKLEITESILIEDREGVVAKMEQLKNLGVKLALDDFGTGYSSLSTLRSFPIDTLKIDRAFVNQLGHDDSSLAIVQAILALAHTMKMDVVGEGVENSYQEGIIRELGCQNGQGYHYDKPLSAENITTRFTQNSQTLGLDAA